MHLCRKNYLLVKSSSILVTCSFFSPLLLLIHAEMLPFLIDVTEEVGNTAAFLASPLASAITGAVIYVDNGLNAMAVGVDSPIFKDLDIPTDKH